ncbi:MAG: hypothetical protein JXA03_05600 [Bacteroidales bacterium]|nr:hypothetical protein [Bacteroidales bacterium]
MGKLRILLSMIAVFLMTAAMAQNPILHWRFANPVVYEISGICTLEFDVEVSCDMPGTFHSDMQLYFDYNTLAFGENVVTNGVLTYERLALLQGDLAGTPLYAIFGNVDNKPYRYAILSEATFTVASPMFMNEIPLWPVFAGYIKVRMNISDQSELAGIQFVPSDGGVGLMNGGQYYLDATHPSATKYGNPPDYEGVYENDLLTQPLLCGGGTTEWTGAVDEDWFNPGNWTAGVPTGAVDALIPNVGKAPFPVIFNGSAVVANITITAGAMVTIAPTGDLTATGLTTVDGFLFIDSDNTGASGSFIDAGGLTGTGNFQFDRYLIQGPGSNDGWHFISSPVNNTVTGDFVGYWVKEWQEANNIYFDIDPHPQPCQGTSLCTVPINVMKGYSVKQDLSYPVGPPPCACWVSPPAGYVIGFGGDLLGSYAGCDVCPPSPTDPALIPNVNTGTITSTISANNNLVNIYPNWNLVGNPYPSGWDYDVFYFGPNWPLGLFDAIYYWDEANMQYASYVNGVGNNGGDNFVPPTQAFFFEADGTVPAINLTFTNAERTHTGSGYYYKDTPDNMLRLEVKGQFTDQTTIRFMEEATAMHDGNYDAKKLFTSGSNVPSLWTKTGNIDLSINAMPATDMVPVFFRGASGTYSISAAENDFETVYLEDLKTGVLHNLESPYEFNYTEGDDANRFIIHFGPINVSGAENGILVYSHLNNIYVYNENNLRGEILVYSVMGQEVTAAGLQDGLNILRMNDANTYYVVKVLAGNALVNTKVYIR